MGPLHTGVMTRILSIPSILGRRLVATLRERSRSRAAHFQLEADLASYTSDAEVGDLLAALSAHDGPDTEHMRSILTGNLARRSRPAA